MKYIILLRGVNVSGQNKIIMKELSEDFRIWGFSEAKTYIQSGNIIVSSLLKVDEIEEIVEDRLLSKYGVDIKAFVIPHEEIKNIIQLNPFPFEDIYVTFLFDQPKISTFELIDKFKKPEEQYIIKGQYIFQYFPNGYGNTKLTNNLFENKLKVTATTRNWNTINKLNELAEKT